MKTEPPGWADVLRTPAGSRLRLSIALKPAWRELLARWLAAHAVALDPLDGASVEVVHLDAAGGLLRSCGPDGGVEIELRHEADGTPALRGRLRHRGRDRPFELPGLALQRGGSREAYVALTVEGRRLPWLKLSHARDGLGFTVTLFPGAFASRFSGATRALLPAQVEVLQVRFDT